MQKGSLVKSEEQRLNRLNSDSWGPGAVWGVPTALLGVGVQGPGSHSLGVLHRARPVGLSLSSPPRALSLSRGTHSSRRVSEG